MLKILYLSQRFGFKTSGIYADLMRELVRRGHGVCIVTCSSDMQIDYNTIYQDNGCKIVYVKVINQFCANKIRKGIAQLQIAYKMRKAIKHLLGDATFDLILYPTPPITFASVVGFCKKKYKATTYLMLKDIFPQNAVDLGMIRGGGLVHKYFRRLEKHLYKYSDYIGCMTKGNIEYLKEHNKNINARKIELFPNTIDCTDLPMRDARQERAQTLFLFGGNLGQPQDILFLLKCIKALSWYERAKFIIIGSGTQTCDIEKYVQTEKCNNLQFMEELPRDEYEQFIANCDVGIVLLNARFTIPNCPARMLSYMAKGIPILAATDTCTDIKSIISDEAKCGLWCPSDSVDDFCSLVKYFCEDADLELMGKNGQDYMKKHYSVTDSVKILESHCNDVKGGHYEQKKSVIVSHPAQQHSYQLANGLIRHDMLNSYCTTVYYKPNRLLYKILGAVLSSQNKKRMKNRTAPDFEHKIKQFSELRGLFYLLLGRICKNKAILGWYGARLRKKFGTRVAKYALRNNADAIIAFDTYALDCFTMLQGTNVIRVLDMSCIPVASLVDIINCELEKDSDFNPSYRMTLSTYTTKLIEESVKELKAADYFLVASEFTKSKLVDFGIDKDKIFVVPYGVDFSRYVITERKKKAEGDKVVFMFVGRMTAVKGIHYFLEAASKLNHNKIECLLVGHMQNSEELLKKYEGIFQYLGVVPNTQMPELYKKADVLVLPSLYDGFGFTVLEAMASGIPVIVSANAGASECVDKGVNGYVVNAGNSDEIFERMRWFIEHPNRIYDMGVAAQESAQTYTWELYYSNIVEIMNNIKKNF